MGEKKYTEEGYLVVAETDECLFWEIDTKPCRSGWSHACFFCRYADFRTEETIRRTEEMPRGTKLYSVCHNEENKASASKTD